MDPSAFVSLLNIRRASPSRPFLVSVARERSASAGALFRSFNTCFADELKKDLAYGILKNDACAAALPLTSSVWPERLVWGCVFLDVSSAAHARGAAT